MRNSENPKDIHMTKEQRAIMKIAGECMQECLETECRNCRDRHIKNMSVLECILQKTSRKLIEAGYAPVVHAQWDEIPNVYMSVASKSGSYRNNATSCPACQEVNPNAYRTNYCPNCGAKMDGGDGP